MYIKLPVPVLGTTDRETLQNLYSSYLQLTKQLEYTFSNLNGYNASDSTISSLIASQGGDMSE